MLTRLVGYGPWPVVRRAPLAPGSESPGRRSGQWDIGNSVRAGQALEPRPAGRPSKLYRTFLLRADFHFVYTPQCSVAERFRKDVTEGQFQEA